MRKRLGIDIDGTVTSPSSLIPFINKQFNLNLTLDDITEYDLSRVLNVSSTDFGKWFSEVEADIYGQSPLALHVSDILEKWSTQFELYFISARPLKVLQVTEEWFKKHQLPYHHIELIGSHNKLEAAKRLKVDLFMEDKHDNAVDIANTLNIPVILFNTPYNQDEVPSLVIRMNNWLEADNWVRNWAKEGSTI